MTCPLCSGPQHESVVRVRRTVTVALWVVGFALAYLLGGQFLHDLVEGLDRTQLPIWKIVLPLAVLLLAVVASFLRRRREVCDRCGAGALFEPLPPSKSAQILSGEGATRRLALRTLGAGGATVAAAAGGLGAAVFRNRG